MSFESLNLLDGIRAVPYFIAITQDPTVAPGYSAKRGTLAVLRDAGTTSLWQKQDDGLSVNWIAVGSGGALPVFPGTTQYRVVDGAGGSNLTGDGSWIKPWASIAHALSQITGESTTQRYCIIVLPGEYAEPLVLRDWISLAGFGQDVSVVTGAVTYPGMMGSQGRTNVSRIGFNNTLDIDHSLATNINLRFLDCRMGSNLTYDGGEDYGNTKANNLFLNSCSILNFTIVDSIVHLYDHHAILGSLTIQNGPRMNSVVGLEINGGLIQGTIALDGRAQLYARGVQVTASLTGTVNGPHTPSYHSDEGSLPLGGILGNVKVINPNLSAITPGMPPYTVQRDKRFIQVNTFGVPYTVQLPPAAELVGHSLYIQRLNPFGMMDVLSIVAFGMETIRSKGAPPASVLSLLQEGESVHLLSDGFGWNVVARN